MTSDRQQTGSISADKPARGTPAFARKTCPVVERQRPAPQTRVARNGSLLSMPRRIGSSSSSSLNSCAAPMSFSAQTRSRKVSPRTSAAQVTSKMRAVLSYDAAPRTDRRG